MLLLAAPTRGHTPDLRWGREHDDGGPRAAHGAPRARHALSLAARRGWSRRRSHGDVCRGAAAGPHGPNVTVDLYAPPQSGKRAPLVVLLQGNEPSQPDERFAFAANVRDSMQRKGVAVAAVSFNIHKGYTLRACAADVARVVQEATGARNPTRLVLVARGLGAWMASILALDSRLLAGAGMDPKRVDGVIVLRGTYDLGEAALEGHPDAASFADMVEDRRESSPIAYARSNSPPFLMLAGGQDNANWARLARPFARALQNAGARDIDYFVVPERGAHSILHWAGRGNELGDLVFTFVGSGPKELPIDNPFGARRRWGARPPLDLSALRKDHPAITTYPVDARLREILLFLVGGDTFELSPWPGKTYQAIDLLGYLAGRPESDVGKGDWLVVSNLQGEEQYFPREVLKKTQPVIVVGLDDEDNLYRLSRFYGVKRAYSWLERAGGSPPEMRNAGGGFMAELALFESLVESLSRADHGLSRSLAQSSPVESWRTIPRPRVHRARPNAQYGHSAPGQRWP